MDNLSVKDKILITPEIEIDDSQSSENGWLERVICVVWHDQSFVSVDTYIDWIHVFKN
ncbi:MAG: hypothetical protein JW841_01800 [Deltaproteobacteria bacterium]|nr:hypothetical protein [Deltaproteobacteria bacterium]